MKNLLSLLSLLLFVSLAFTSCKKEEEVTLTAEDLTYNYVGCPENANQRFMGKVNATTTTGTPAYSIVSQSAVGVTNFNVLTINSSTGEIAVKDNVAADDLLNFYYDNGANNIRKITVVVAVSNGSETKNVNVTINLSFNCS